MEEENKEDFVIYDEQDKVENEILKSLRLKYFIRPYVREAYLFGDLAEKKFGFYRKPKKDGGGKFHYGSEVVLVILADEKFATPADWKREGDIIFEKYDFGKIRGIKMIKDNQHQVFAYVFRPSLKENSVGNKNKSSEEIYRLPNRRLALEYWLRKQKNKLWYKKKYH
jgi:hypothetical protein